MKKAIMSLLDKKTNRLHRLNDYRKKYTLASDNRQFEIEVSSEALVKLKKRKPLYFSIEKDFGIKDGTEKKYWLRIENEYPNKKTDFSYLVTGNIIPSQHCGGDHWGIALKIGHIDVSTTWGMMLGMLELIAEWIDKKYGKDYGFKRGVDTKSLKLDFIKNKKQLKL